MAVEGARRRTECPAAGQLAQYLARTLTPGERAAVETHALECQDCRRLLVDAAELAAGANGGGRPLPAWPDDVGSYIRRPMAIAWALAAAAALVLAIRIVPTWLRDPGMGEPPTVSRSANELVLAQLDETDAAAVREALQTLRLQVPEEVARLRGTVTQLRGGDGTLPRLVDPVATRVSTTQPQFAWQPVAGDDGAEYAVTVFDSRGQEIASGEWTRESRWMLPRDLGRDEVYSWQLGVRRGGTVIYIPGLADPSARFEVVSEDDARRIAEVLRRTSAAPAVQGILLARAGLLAEAESALAQGGDRDPEAGLRARLFTALRSERAGAGGR
jgi:hypothetical protein